MLCVALVALALCPRTLGFLGEEGVDQYGTQWFYWFVGDSVSRGELPPASTTLFFFPWGKDLYAHTGSNILDAAFAEPFRALLGPVWGYDLFVALGLLFNGWAFTRLAARLTEDRLAGAAAALWVALSPFALYEVLEGRPTQAIFGLAALFFAQLIDLRRPGWRAPLLAGLTLALTGYVYWFYAFFCGVAALVLGLLRVAEARPEERASSLARHALAGGLAMALVLPSALPLLLASAGARVPGLLDVDAWSLSAVSPTTVEGFPIGLYMLQPLRASAGFYHVDPQGLQLYSPEHAVLGVVEPLALIGGWMVAKKSERRWLFALLALSLLLATGPIFVLGASWLPNPFYIGLVKLLDFLRRLWWPGRAWMLGTLAVGGCLALTLAALGRAERRLRDVAILGLLGLLLAEHSARGLAPFPTWDAAVPAGYRCLAEGPPGAVLELPYAWSQAHVYYQTAHGRPIFGGMIEDNPVFTPEPSRALREENSFVKALLAYAPEDDSVAPWTPEDRAALGALGYRYVVLQKSAYSNSTADPPMIQRARETWIRRGTRQLRAALGPAVWEDERTAIFSPWGAPSPCEGHAAP